jgi:hypothetical protein
MLAYQREARPSLAAGSSPVLAGIYESLLFCYSSVSAYKALLDEQFHAGNEEWVTFELGLVSNGLFFFAEASAGIDAFSSQGSIAETEAHLLRGFDALHRSVPLSRPEISSMRKIVRNPDGAYERFFDYVFQDVDGTSLCKRWMRLFLGELDGVVSRVEYANWHTPIESFRLQTLISAREISNITRPTVDTARRALALLEGCYEEGTNRRPKSLFRFRDVHTIIGYVIPLAEHVRELT